MTVFVLPDKTSNELGAKRWEVEWHTIKPSALKRVREAEARGQHDEFDPDADIRAHVRHFLSTQKDLALRVALAACKCKNSAYGCATLTEQIVDWRAKEDRIAEWTDSGEPKYLP